MTIFGKTGHVIASPFVALWKAFDIRDVLLLGGLTMLGRGLYLRWGEWLAFSVCGGLLMIIGYLMRGK